MIEFLIGLFVFGCIAIMVYIGSKGPYGYQNESGFHYGEPSAEDKAE